MNTKTEIWNQIQKVERILLHCHPNTDGDSVGSVLAMRRILLEIGKQVTVIAGDNDPMPHYLSFLPDYEKIVRKNFFQIDLTDFDLFLILDTASPNQISKKAPINLPISIPTLVIDHHVSNPAFADLNYIDPSSPATCQMLYELFREWKVEIDHDTALCLYVGIYSDTGGFIYEKTSEKTLLAAAELTSLVPEFTQYTFKLLNSNNPSWIFFSGKALNNVQVWYGGKVAITSVSHEEIEKSDIKSDDLGGAGSFVGNLLRSVIGWEISIVCTEIEPNKVKISFRSRNPKHFDVSKLAVVLGGGGHPGAAGTNIESSLEAIFSQIKLALSNTYPEFTNFSV